MIDKIELKNQGPFETAAAFVRTVIESARRRRGVPGCEMIPQNVRIVDSLGMRSFRAAFSDETLGDIVRDETGDWGPVRVESMTSGYSGAFMLALRADPVGPSLIIKVARSEATIARELRAQREHLADLAPFGARFAPISSEMSRLRDRSGVYYRQMPLDACTVLTHCMTQSTESNIIALERIVRMCLRVLNAVPVKQRRVEAARKRFVLSPVDIGRLETSANFLADLGTTLKAEGLWSERLPAPRVIADDVIRVAQVWSSDELTAVNLPEAVQHGDLNPGNVMIDGEGVPVLIDFQRLGPWPLGYDIGRLARLLRIRTTDARDRMDWLPSRFPYWCEDAVATAFGGESKNPVGPEAAYCENEFLRFTAALEDDERALVEFGYRLGALWDLIKVTSYQDISVFKRAWALVLSWSLIERLRKDRGFLSFPVSVEKR